MPMPMVMVMHRIVYLLQTAKHQKVMFTTTLIAMMQMYLSIHRQKRYAMVLMTTAIHPSMKYPGLKPPTSRQQLQRLTGRTFRAQRLTLLNTGA